MDYLQALETELTEKVELLDIEVKKLRLEFDECRYQLTRVQEEHDFYGGKSQEIIAEVHATIAQFPPGPSLSAQLRIFQVQLEMLQNIFPNLLKELKHLELIKDQLEIRNEGHHEKLIKIQELQEEYNLKKAEIESNLQNPTGTGSRAGA